MLRRIRRKLREIEYHSARRERTVWSRAIVVAVLLALPLACAAVFAMDRSVARDPAAATVWGHLYRDSAGTYRATIIPPEFAAFDWSDEPDAYASFSIQVISGRRGWPFITSYSAPTPRLDMQRIGQIGIDNDVKLELDDPMHAAIHEALITDGQHHNADIWLDPGEGFRPHVTTWFGAIVATWLAFSLLAIVAIRVLHFVVLIATGKRANKRNRLRRENKCLSCGYDLTGLEFNERCPECGEIVW